MTNDMGGGHGLDGRPVVFTHLAASLIHGGRLLHAGCHVFLDRVLPPTIGVIVRAIDADIVTSLPEWIRVVRTVAMTAITRRRRNTTTGVVREPLVRLRQCAATQLENVGGAGMLRLGKDGLSALAAQNLVD